MNLGYSLLPNLLIVTQYSVSIIVIVLLKNYMYTLAWMHNIIESRIQNPHSIIQNGSPVNSTTREGKGLVTFERVLASSVFLFSRKPIKFQVPVILHLVAKQRCTRSGVLV